MNKFVITGSLVLTMFFSQMTWATDELNQSAKASEVVDLILTNKEGRNNEAIDSRVNELNLEGMRAVHDRLVAKLRIEKDRLAAMEAELDKAGTNQKVSTLNFVRALYTTSIAMGGVMGALKLLDITLTAKTFENFHRNRVGNSYYQEFIKSPAAASYIASSNLVNGVYKPSLTKITIIELKSLVFGSTSTISGINTPRAFGIMGLGALGVGLLLDATTGTISSTEKEALQDAKTLKGEVQTIRLAITSFEQSAALKMKLILKKS